MTMKKAASRVQYSGGVYEQGALYNLSMPAPDAVYRIDPDLVYEWSSSIYVIETNANEDFNLPLQLTRLQMDGSEIPLDLGAAPVLEFYIRPRFDHITIIRKLTVGSGITIEDAANGKLTLYLSQATVASDLIIPKWPAQHWDYFFNWLDGGAVTELFRGPLVIHAGLYP